MDFPFRGGQMVCFGACDTRAAILMTTLVFIISITICQFF